MHWLDDYPVFRTLPKCVAAADYNRIRIGLLRHRGPLRLAVPKFRCMECVLDDAAWVCVDACADDQPILAWTGFEVAGRDALDQPVRCQLKIYHLHAGLVMGSALEAVAEAVDSLRARSE